MKEVSCRRVITTPGNETRCVIGHDIGGKYIPVMARLTKELGTI